MDAIEKRARELLAAVSKERYGWIGELWNIALRDSPEKVRLSGSDAINAVVAALTPPEGYVLVPKVATDEMQMAALRAPWGKETPAGLWDAMLAARPEVP